MSIDYLSFYIRWITCYKLNLPWGMLRGLYIGIQFCIFYMTFDMPDGGFKFTFDKKCRQHGEVRLKGRVLQLVRLKYLPLGRIGMRDLEILENFSKSNSRDSPAEPDSGHN